jgi:hypothetical protein
MIRPSVITGVIALSMAIYVVVVVVQIPVAHRVPKCHLLPG